jgi:hypothetical protein
MVCPPATSEAGARWPRRGVVVVVTTSCRDNKVQMIRPYMGCLIYKGLAGAAVSPVLYRIVRN